MTESTTPAPMIGASVGHWRATYTPGSWVVLSGPTAMVVVQPAPAKASALLNSMWEVVVSAASIHELAERLAAFHVDRMPSFAAFYWDGEGLRSLVRGAVRVMDLATGEFVADGEGVQTWTEVGLGDVRQVRIDMEGDPEESQGLLQLPLVVGAVTASAVVLDATDEARISSPQQLAPAPASGAGAGAGADEPAPSAEPAASVEPAASDEPDEAEPSETAPVDHDSADESATPAEPAQPVDADTADAAPAGRVGTAAGIGVAAVGGAAVGAVAAAAAGAVSGPPAASRFGAPPLPPSNQPSNPFGFPPRTDQPTGPSTATPAPSAASAASAADPFAAGAGQRPQGFGPLPGQQGQPPQGFGPPPGQQGPPPGQHGPPPGQQGPPPGQHGPPPGQQGQPPQGFGPPPGQQGQPPQGFGPPPGQQGQPPQGFGPPPGQQGQPPQGFGPPPGQQGQPPQGFGPPPGQQGQPPQGFGPPPGQQGQPPQGFGPPPGQQGQPFGAPPASAASAVPPHAGPFGSVPPPPGSYGSAPPTSASSAPTSATSAPFPVTSASSASSAPASASSASPPPSAAEPFRPLPANRPQDEVDHDGATIFATGLARSLKSSDQHVAGGNDLVLAAMCNLQHPNEPGSQACTRCGGQIPPQNPRLVTRPSLAVLRSSHGERVDLDRMVLIGRSPTATRVPREQLPTMLAVPSPSHDISRTHVEVAPDGWRLYVKDLYSTNGTTLVRPGADMARERLVPGEPVEVRIGWIIDLGDGVTVTIDPPA